MMAHDEGRFGRLSRPRRCWAPKPLRPTVPRRISREFGSVFAPVGARLGRLTAWVLPTANTGMRALFLAHLAQECREYFIVLPVERAGWHLTPRLAVPDNIRLLPQPAGSPELNPPEHSWDELREKALPNIAFSSLPPLGNKLGAGMRDLSADTERVRSMTDFPYLRNPF
jgi:hypothetical protein